MIVVAVGFDFTNGFHDTANAVATTVSTRALTPRLAVLIAAVMNLRGRVRLDRRRQDRRQRPGLTRRRVTVQVLVAALLGRHRPGTW